ncbi:elongation of very long chain fatty acids protein [Nesidiocoris tenuis]|uniref:Elongation of very long chain fatty acids protein n=1 Tax=Nesidiocoris tenuis TaxID=355587 RepID=A0ABN7AZG3_9HEMI|nr:elongation of very long chain fatty acids protein [Nesidiocoris tenuis]
MEVDLVESLYNKTAYKDEEDALLDSWGFISRPAHVYWTSLIYLLVVFIGPKIMSDRKPMELRKTIMAYNIFQITMNSYVLVLYYRLFGSQSLRWWENLCCPVSAAQDFRPLVSLEYMEALKLFYINKIVDMVDTFFFVLRKKQSQITFLHVYHHVNMVVTTYLSAMYFREEMSMMFATLNSATHAIMYGYYFLAAFGPAIQKYLWWKKYITTIQIIQFLIAMCMLLISKFKGCPMAPSFFYMWIINVSIFLLMFLRFYINAYKHKKM